MIYKNIVHGRFVSRPNRFIANVFALGEVRICHVKNTGRCRELLVPDANVILERCPNPNRKTEFDLVSVYKGERLINMDSQAPNILVGELLKRGGLFKDITLIKPEVRLNSSRIDFYVEAGGEKIFVEVKGVTLEENGAAFFPDAPTQRGVKHLGELSRIAAQRGRAAVIFVIQMKGISYFSPNAAMHPQFAFALKEAQASGVELYAFDCFVRENGAEIADRVEIRL